MSPSPILAALGRWVVYRPNTPPRWGSEVRRQALFEALARRTEARIVARWSLLERRGNELPLRWLRRSPGADRPLLAASEQPPRRAWDAVNDWTRPFAVGIYDDPVAQASAIGAVLDKGTRADASARLAFSTATFEWLVVPTASFAALIGLDPHRVLVGGNGTDTRRIVPGPFPELPTIGMVSGASAGRGIEALIEAARALRSGYFSDLRLILWLIATSEVSARYLDALRQAQKANEWIEFSEVPHLRLGTELARATVLCIPHPKSDYLDTALPVKLLDSLAAGRPVVVTPRTETARVISKFNAGVVAAGDRPDDLAAALRSPLSSPSEAAALGALARTAAHSYDWDVVGGRLAELLMERAIADRRLSF